MMVKRKGRAAGAEAIGYRDAKIVLSRSER